MVRLTPLQSVRIHGWWDPRPVLLWEDVTRLGLTLNRLLELGLRPSDLVCLQPEPMEWVRHAGAGLGNARDMVSWPANPFTHMGADLGDVLAQRFSAEELRRMGVTYAQLVRHGMTEETERMFRYEARDWAMLGKPQLGRHQRRPP